MKIKSTSVTGNFEILNILDDRLVELQYSNWFSSNSKARFNSTDIEIKPKNKWGDKFDIFKNGAIMGSIVFNNNREILIYLENTKQYLLKAIGTWDLGFALTDENGVGIISLKPKMDWKKFSYNYGVTIDCEATETAEIIELLIFAGFGANLYISTMMV